MNVDKKNERARQAAPSVDLADIVARHGVEGFDEQRYVEVTRHDNLPDGFTARGNRVYVPKGRQQLPPISESRKFGPPTNAVLILNGADDYSVRVWGDGGFLYMARDARLRDAEVGLGAATIIIGEMVRTTSHAEINARNGGRIHLKRDMIIGKDVRIATDDAHTLMDATTGKRLNIYGGVIEIGEHVWIGRRAYIMGNCTIGDHNVIGACAVVRSKKTPPNVALVGVPARIVRTNVTWHYDDIAPDDAPAALKAPRKD